VPAETPTAPHLDSFVLIRDGTRTLAFTDSHGRWIRWLAPAHRRWDHDEGESRPSAR
jgi:hypothetical protein